MKKIIRITTVPQSLETLLEGQLAFMRKHYDVIAISSNEEKMKLISKSEGVKVYTLELTRKITPIKDLIAVYKLCRILRKEKPFIVHSHTPKAGIVGMMAAFLMKVPHRLHTVAGMPLLEAVGVKRKLLDIVEKVTYKFATKIYPNSYGLKEIIVDLEFASSIKLKVIANGSSNGIDTDFFSPSACSKENNEALRHKLNIVDNDFVFIFVGRIVGDKGVNELALAFDRLSSRQANIKLLLVGSEEKELDPLTSATNEIIKNNLNIISVGYQDDVRPYLSIANALVFPSYREGFPNVVMQAGAMQIPAIVTDINGCNEIVREGVNGLIVPVKDVDSLYDRMRLLLTLSNEQQEQMGIISRSEMMRKYGREFVWQSLLDEYKSVENV